MDLHFTSDEPTTQEKSAVDGVLGPAESRWLGGERLAECEGQTASTGHAIRAQRDRLLPVLHGIQSGIGWISPGALNYACKRLNVPPAEAFGVADFYALLSVRPRPPVVVHVCDDIACLTKGAGENCRRLEQQLGPAGSPGEDGKTAWIRSPCLGLCERAPAALLSAAGEHSWGESPGSG